jgi:predicted RecA/RadA family phage recombinase
MNPRKMLAAALILALALGTFVTVGYVVAQAKEKAYSGPTFEYKIEGMRLLPKWTEEGGKKMATAPELEGMFNFNGGQGWEYVGSFPGKEDVIFIVFKRPKQ